MKASYLIAIGLLLIFNNVFAQVKIGDPSIPGSVREPHASAMLEIESANRGFLPPRVSLTSVLMLLNATTPADGSMVYNTNTQNVLGLTGVGIYVWHNEKWNKLPDSGTNGAGYLSAGLSGDQTVTSGTLIQITPVGTNTIDLTGNKITLKAGGIYRLRASGSLVPGNTSTFAYLAWRQSGTTVVSGHQGLLLSSGYGSGYSSGSDAVALVTVGSADMTYELYCRDAGNANVVLDSRTLDVAVDQLAAAKEVSTTSGLSFGFRNKIINGNFNVNQRERTGTVTLAANTYGHDRWRAGSSGCTYTFNTVGGVTTLNITSGTLQQVIEGNNLEPEIYTLSWTGTAQGKVGTGAAGASGLNANITGGSNVTIEFGTGSLSKVQFEASSFATRFEFRPYPVEEDLCMRYFEKFFFEGGEAASSGTIGTGLDSWLTIPFKVTKMRVGELTQVGTAAPKVRIGKSAVILGINNAYAVLRSGSYLDAEIY